ncbi:hypothetical protein T4B_9947 [Trichinella pseudospiralis]|uniref:Reverse transcriptase domain-containing protein n=1 Tax=Trichinella pseudospiralis TaxID=6337 RepID=A0A0V1H2R6_TRIPS|nr:hypothetical protein T4B_9947 [Trichinella pseudospiralis]
MDDSDKADIDSTRAVQNFGSTLHFDGIRYTVKLIWLKDDAQLPNNYHKALSRLQQMEQSVKNDPQKQNSTKEVCENIWKKILWQTERVIQEEYVIYLIMQLFEKIRSPPNVELYLTVLRGAEVRTALQNDLTKVLLRFQRFRIGLQADISKKFLQTGLNEKDRDVCRFLWRSCDVPEAPCIYRFKRLCFGLVCSSFLAMSVIRHHVKKYQHQFPEAVNEVLENMYVDDLLFSVDEEESASEMVAQLKKMMKLGGFLLTKWAKRDELSYLIPSNVDPNTLYTKRQLISTTAKMYDPLRISLEPKILFQRLWQQEVDCDDKLPDNVHQKWKKWKTELMDIPEI